MTELLHWGSDDLPDKQRFWNRPGSGSLALSAVAAVGIGASAFLGVGYLRYERLITADQTAAAHVERANADLQDQLAQLRDRLGGAERALNSAQGRIANLSDETQRQQAASEQTTTTKTDRIGQLTHSLDQAQRDMHLAEAQRVTLMARLSKAEADLAEWQARQQQTQAGVDQWQKKVQQLTADRDKAATERDQMRVRLEQLEQKLSARQTARSMAEAQHAPVPPVAAAAPAAATAPVVAAAAPPALAAVAPMASVAAPSAVAPAPSDEVVRPQPALALAMAAPAPALTVPAPSPGVATANRGGMVQFERVLASAGVDVAHLFSQFGVNRGEGGPFIPAPRGMHPDNTLSPDKLAALGRLVKALPVSAPLTSYEIGSPFGVREDPINGRSSYHTGLDFRAPYESPVYATAPGVVTFSGYRDDYGKIVEIDHGNGISTRYAHLHRAIVSVGQQVTAHMQIGFLGSSGRATGPHVHYEVLVNGEPQDPQKFMGLARLVPVAQQ